MKVPTSYMQDVAQPQNAVTSDKYVAPEQLLIAAANMDKMGRLFEGGPGAKQVAKAARSQKGQKRGR
jgi:hypothetical protein